MSEETDVLRGELDALRREVRGLGEQLHLLVVSARKTRQPPVAPSPATTGLPPTVTAPRTARAWRTMTATQASTAWAVLTDFVDWLVARYQLCDVLAPCWYRHGAMVEELHALQLAWLGAYEHAQARLPDPAQWHELLHRTLTRLRDWDRYGCAAGTHRDDAVLPAGADQLARRVAYIRQDIGHRVAGDGQPSAPRMFG